MGLPATKEKAYFLALQGYQAGPFSFAQIKDLGRGGRLLSEDLIWHEGLPSWVQIKDLPEFKTAPVRKFVVVQPQEQKKQPHDPDQTTILDSDSPIVEAPAQASPDTEKTMMMSPEPLEAGAPTQATIELAHITKAHLPAQQPPTTDAKPVLESSTVMIEKQPERKPNTNPSLRLGENDLEHLLAVKAQAAASPVPADLGQRLLANLIDGMILMVPLILHRSALTEFLIPATYFIFTQGGPWHATVGKFAMKTEVRGVNGQPLTYMRSFARFALSAIPFLWPVSLITILSKPSRQAIHDLICETIVVKKSG